jgi:hypothetical protein
MRTAGQDRHAGAMHESYYYVLIAALTSAVVALGIEWLAKPRLDARKERILSARRARDAFGSRLLQIEVLAALWKDLPPVPAPAASQAERQRLRAERDRTMDQVGDITAAMFDELGSYALTHASMPVPGGVGPMPIFIARYVTLARGIAISDRTAVDKLRTLHDMTSPLRICLFGSAWHPVRRIRALATLPSLLDKVDGTVSEESPE